jgi:hypothetical protein
MLVHRADQLGVTPPMQTIRKSDNIPVDIKIGLYPTLGVTNLLLTNKLISVDKDKTPKFKLASLLDLYWDNTIFNPSVDGVSTTPKVFKRWLKLLRSYYKNGWVSKEHMEKLIEPLHWSLVYWGDATEERCEKIHFNNTIKDMEELIEDFGNGDVTVWIFNQPFNPQAKD